MLVLHAVIALLKENWLTQYYKPLFKMTENIFIGYWGLVNYQECPILACLFSDYLSMELSSYLSVYLSAIY